MIFLDIPRFILFIISPLLSIIEYANYDNKTPINFPASKEL